MSFKGKGHGTITGLGGLLENITFDIVTDQKSSVLAYFKNTYGVFIIDSVSFIIFLTVLI